jgi:RNA polymerase sigma-70 factor, ECF subfamily
MGANEAGQPRQLDEFRNYLRLLASIQIPASLWTHIDPMELAQATLAEAARDPDRGSGEITPAVLRQVLVRLLHERVTREAAAATHPTPIEPLEVAIKLASARIEQWLAPAGATSAAQAEREACVQRLADALAALPVDQRVAVELKHLLGWTVAAISRHMHCSEIAVASLLRLALERVHSILMEAS